MSAAPDALVGKTLADTYQVVRCIGKGGMGAIYEAHHARLQGKRYAIKILSPQFAENPELLTRFRREAEIASQLGHEHIVEVHDFNLSEGQAYMVMELLEGQDLAGRLQTRGAMPLAQVCHIVNQLASALDAAHRAHIVHRDLKPQNLFLCQRAGRDDYVKVLDFGISKVLDSASVVTRDHALIGTPYYMSPEQAEGRVAEIDSRTDVFALGAIIWEMLTGKMAFGAPTFSVALYKVCFVDPPEVHHLRPDVPPAVSAVLRRALAKERQQRTQTVVELAQELAAAASGVMPAGVPPPAPDGTGSVAGVRGAFAPAPASAGGSAPPSGSAGTAAQGAPHHSAGAGTPYPAPPGAPGTPYSAAPAAPYSAAPAPYSAAPGGPYSAAPGAPYSAAPGGPYSAAPGAPYSAAPGGPYSAAPGAPYSAAPGAPYSAAPGAPYSAAPAAPYSAAPGGPYSAAPGAPYSAAPGAPYSAAPGAPYSAAPAAPYSAAPGGSYSQAGFPGAGSAAGPAAAGSAHGYAAPSGVPSQGGQPQGTGTGHAAPGVGPPAWTGGQPPQHWGNAPSGPPSLATGSVALDEPRSKKSLIIATGILAVGAAVAVAWLVIGGSGPAGPGPAPGPAPVASRPRGEPIAIPVTGPGPAAPTAPGAAPSAPGAAPSAPGAAPSAPGAAPSAPAETPSSPGTVVASRRPADIPPLVIPPPGPSTPARPGGTAPTLPSAAGAVALAFAVEPSDAAATIRLAGAVVHNRRAQVARSDRAITISAEAKGFLVFRQEVVPDHDQTITITLRRGLPASKGEPSRPPSGPEASTPPATIPYPPTAQPAPAAEPPAQQPPAQQPPVAQPQPQPPPPPPPPQEQEQPKPPPRKTGTIFDQ